MKKVLFSIFVLSLFQYSATADILLDDNKSCIVDTNYNGGGLNWGWVCGKIAVPGKCSGKLIQGGGRGYDILNNGDKWIHKYGEKAINELGGNYWCCDGSATKTGRFVRGNTFERTETRTQKLTNGSCTYTVKINLCGDETGTPCTIPTTCDYGYELKNGTCIKPEPDPAPTGNNGTDDGQGHTDDIQSEKPVIDGPTTPAQSDPQYTAYSISTMEKCWKCGQVPETFKNCLEIVSLPNSEKQKHPHFNDIKTECQI